MVVVVAAAATFVTWSATGTLSDAVEHTIALLIVACPCALGLATPLTMAVAIGLAARKQILIKNAAVLEVLARNGRVLLDKTGTITFGRPAVVEWVGPAWFQPIVAHAESHSSHPVARALVEEYGDIQIVPAHHFPKDTQEHGDGGILAYLDGQRLLVGAPRFLKGHGVAIDGAASDHIERFEAEGLTTIGVALAGKLEAIAALGDKVHGDAARAISALIHQGWHPTIVSGDAAGVVHKVAEEVGLARIATHAEVPPEEKMTLLMASQKAGESTVMVGDGVNDAAALAAADVGIAVEGGAEASLAAADVYVAAPGLMPVVELVSLARRTKRVVRQNLVIALGYNALAVSFAAAGYITPLVAAILMPISSATVLASSMSIAIGSRR